MERETGDKVVDYELRVYSPADGVNTSYDYTHWNNKGKSTETQEVDTNKRLRMYHYALDNRYTNICRAHQLEHPLVKLPYMQTPMTAMHYAESFTSVTYVLDMQDYPCAKCSPFCCRVQPHNMRL